MSTWSSTELRGLVEAPRALADEVLSRVGLDPTPELVEVAELGLTAIDSALAMGRPEPLADQLSWQRVRLHALGADDARAETPSAMVATIGERVSLEVASYVRELMIIADALAVVAADPASDLSDPVVAPHIAAFLERALAGDETGAGDVLTGAVEAGLSVTSVLVDVVEAAQVEVGRRWEVGTLSVAQEHQVTATVRAALARLHPYLFRGARNGKRLVAVCATGSGHDVGLRMVTDLLEAEGWATSFLGSAVSAEDLPSLAVGADVLALSASMADQLPVVRTMIEALRADERTQHIPVAVGGAAFRHEVLATGVGADGCAQDARSAVELCTRLAEASAVPMP